MINEFLGNRLNVKLTINYKADKIKIVARKMYIYNNIFTFENKLIENNTFHIRY